MEFGEVMTRPTDRKENYVKRCVGLPGQTLQIKDRVIYLDGKENKEPDNAQFSYDVTFVRNAKLTNEFLEENHITLEDLGIMEYDQSMRAFFKSNDYITLVYNNVTMPLTRKTAEVLKQRKDLVESIAINTEASEWDIYPLNGNKHWTRDNYGPIWIPKKGETIELTLDNLPIYERPIRAYEKNDLRVTDDGKILINGQEATSYTFKMDYYWMMGDNRHNSLDSRYWGFVPEDHIVGKPIFIWLSSDPDRSGFSGIRWNRLFRMVDGIK
jgi:signal peptidase I